MRVFSKHTIGANDARLWEGDGGEMLRRLPRESVDLIVTSPPYFIGKAYDTSVSARDFENEIQRLLPAIVRALRPSGNLCWQIGNHMAAGALVPLDYLVLRAMEGAGFTLRNRLIWTFGHGANATRRFSGRHETILWFSKGDQFWFDLDAARVPQKYPGKRYYKGPRKGQWSGNPLGKNPGDVWEDGAVWDIPNVKAKHPEKTGHPCQFPVALVMRLISALCPPSGLVADPYVGSGTSAVAANMLGRRFVGSDLDVGYLEIAKRRLDDLKAGELKVRADVPIREPIPNESVAITPPHFRPPLRIVNG